MKDPVKVLFITQEIFPYEAESPQSKICREFPQYIQEQGCEIRTFTPCYGTINERRNQLHEVQRLSGMNLIIDDTDRPLIIKVASIQSARMQVYFIDNEDFFGRKGTVVDEDGNEYDDNDKRTIFYVRGVLETIKKLRWTPDIIHCHGWLTALAPIYIKKAYHDDPFFKHSKVVYSIYDDDFSTPFPAGYDHLLALPGIVATDVEKIAGKSVSYVDLQKLALDYSDAAIFAAPTINGDVEAYAKSKMPCLTYNDEYKENYSEFFEQTFPLITK